MADLDPRLLRLGIEVADRTVFYDNLAITATGQKFNNENQADANITIANVNADVRDFVITQGTPFLRDRQQAQKRITLDAGRESTGLSRVYSGNIFRATLSSPPDQTLRIRAITQQAAKSTIVRNNFPGQVSLRIIAERVASDIGVTLEFEATDKMVADYSFTGSATEQVRKLQQAGTVNAYIDNDTLIIKDNNRPLSGFVRVLTPDNGLVGIPKPTEHGIKVNMMFDNRVTVGGLLDLQSRRYPSLSGQYLIYKLGYNLSNRDTPFYLTAEATRQ